ncbi:MAG: SMP-30/gluconolactonase/LRE family protein [Rhizobiaceae bacterium]
MFEAPPRIEATVVARVPEVLRIRRRRSPWAETHRPGAVTDCFLEGPSFDRDGNLYMVDVAWGRILMMSPSGVFSVVTEYDGSPNGLKIHADGRIFVADFARGLLQLDPAGGLVRTIVDSYEGKPFHGLNDLHFASNGDLYFTDQGLSGLQDPFGRVFRLRADGRLDLVLDRVPSPNGLVLDRAERTLFVNVTRDNAVWRVPMHRDGSAYKVGAFIRLSGGMGPDGLAMDSDGNLAVAHIGLGCVWLVGATGEPMLRVQSPAGRMTTNVAFGGQDNRTLFITESETGCILAAELPVPGHPMFAHS